MSRARVVHKQDGDAHGWTLCARQIEPGMRWTNNETPVTCQRCVTRFRFRAGRPLARTGSPTEGVHTGPAEPQ